MKEVKQAKFLGEYFSCNLEDSIHQTVLKRIGSAKQSIFEIRAVIEDKRSKQLGGINLAFDIWEASVIPMLAYNSETWSIIPKKTIKVLNDLFNLFYRKIFKIGNGSPITNFYWQCAAFKVEFIILQRKLNFQVKQI